MSNTLSERLAFEAQLAADLEALVAEFTVYLRDMEAAFGPYVTRGYPIKR